MIPFIDLKAQHQPLRAEIAAALDRLLDSSQFVLGEEVAAFEREFATHCGAAHAVAVNSGTSALHLALLAAGVGPGDEVVTVPFTFVATAAAIHYCGAQPVFVDIDPRTFTLDVSRLEAALTARTKAILPVHLYGQPADMDPIMEIAGRRGLMVIEDAAQAHDAEYKGRRVGGLGDLGCFSFYPGKNLGACGEGGIVVTNDAAHARTIRMLRDWGQERKYHHVLRGFNYRMEGIQGAVLRIKLRRLEAWTEARRARAYLYDALLERSGVGLPAARPGDRHVYHIYAVRSPRRDALQKALHVRGVQTGIHYPVPVHLQPAYADPAYGPGSFPHAERAANEVLSLPLYAELRDDQVQTVAGAVREGLCEGRHAA
jgi:dTDP-4-amino-4,6-dideoxygalactose transaminase